MGEIEEVQGITQREGCAVRGSFGGRARGRRPTVPVGLPFTGQTAKLKNFSHEQYTTNKIH